MYLSRFYLPVLKETPAEATIISHQLMLRAGMVRQQGAGIYAWLPLGHRVLRKIEQIVREEQNRAGAVEMLMPTIQPADLWRESGRYDAYGKEMLRIKDRQDRDMLFGPTNEEMITEIFRAGTRSYKDLPKLLYHIQWKFRDEIRPRFGVMRGREFLMKDAYSFDISKEAARHSYNRMFVSYLRTYARMGLNSIPMRAETGPIGGDLSHEFIVLADTGESEVFCDKRLVDMPVPSIDTDYDSDLQGIVDERTNLYAATDEMHEPSEFENKVEPGDRTTARGIEVGHIFFFGTKYSDSMNAKVSGPEGKDIAVEMGSYGIGVSRLMGALIEAYHDDGGCKWPIPVAPFHAGLINLKVGDEECDKACADMYQKLESAGVEVLYDDTGARAGEKFARMDLIGLPYQLTIGPRGLKNGVIEVKSRDSGEKQELSADEAINFVSRKIAEGLEVH